MFLSCFCHAFLLATFLIPIHFLTAVISYRNTHSTKHLFVFTYEISDVLLTHTEKHIRYSHPKFHICFTMSTCQLSPLAFFKCLSEDTRLKTLLMLSVRDELCVCDLTEALQLSQPKISRHLADLRKCELVQDTRKGKWVYYRLHPNLPQWASNVISQTAKHNANYIESAMENLTCTSC